MSFTTFEQLPSAVTEIFNKLLEIEKSLVRLSSAKNSDQDKKALLTVKEAAEFLKISVPTMYGLISKGSVPCMKVTKRVYFLHDDLVSYVLQGKKKTMSEIEKEADKFLSRGGKGKMKKFQSIK